MWVGIGAAFTGIVKLMIPAISAWVSVVIFAVFSIAISLIGRKIYNPANIKDHPNLNSPGSQYIGTVITLKTPIENGIGRADIGNSSWSLKGADANAGDRVRIISLESTSFIVEKAED